jgi:hypothetical protein
MFLGGAVLNQLNDADEIIPVQNILQPGISPGGKLKFPLSNEDIFLTQLSARYNRTVREKWN